MNAEQFRFADKAVGRWFGYRFQRPAGGGVENVTGQRLETGKSLACQEVFNLDSFAQSAVGEAATQPRSGFGDLPLAG
jgi:hypothetical protein